MNYSKREKTHEEQLFHRTYGRFPDEKDLTNIDPKEKRELKEFVKSLKGSKGFCARMPSEK
jgi:hypothetical protein